MEVWSPNHWTTRKLPGCFLLLSCRGSLYILDMNPLSGIWYANIFSFALSFQPFLLLHCLFNHCLFMHKVFNFYVIQFTYFFLYCLCFSCHIPYTLNLYHNSKLIKGAYIWLSHWCSYPVTYCSATGRDMELFRNGRVPTQWQKRDKKWPCKLSVFKHKLI